MRPLFAATALVLLSGCQTDGGTSATAAPDARAQILASKGGLWKDPDSIKNASITEPRRHMGFMWHVCVKANARGGGGGYTGEKDMLIGLYDDSRAPAVLMADATGYCDYPHEPFAELNGDYTAPPAASKKPAKRT